MGIYQNPSLKTTSDDKSYMRTMRDFRGHRARYSSGRSSHLAPFTTVDRESAHFPLGTKPAIRDAEIDVYAHPLVPGPARRRPPRRRLREGKQPLSFSSETIAVASAAAARASIAAAVMYIFFELAFRAL